MFDNGITLKGKSLDEQNMNLDLKAAYERVLVFAREHADVTVERLKELSALTMKNTGSEYHTALDGFSSANGDIGCEGSRRQSTGLMYRNLISRRLLVGKTATEVKAR